MLQAGLLFFIGAIFGSFLNVCIYRLPRKESVVTPGSHCPRCGSPIPLWYNIPLVSYLLLRGRCRNCAQPIPIRYPLVEALTGALFVLVWHSYGFGPSFFYYAILVLFLVPISFIDLDTKLILNVLTLPGICLGLLLSLFFDSVSPAQSLLGLVLGGGFLWLLGLLGEFAFKKESMGGGDIKLGALIGVFLGPEVIIALFLAFFLAFPVIALGMSTKKLHRNSTVPFGPFISLAAIVVICFGQAMYQFYLSLIL